MKIIRYVGAVLLAAFAGQGCSLLDTTPDGRETLDQIFADHDKTAAYLNTCYSKLPTKGTSYYWVCNAPTALSDEGYLVSGTINDAIPAKMYTSGGTASSHPVRDYSDDENYYSAYMLQLRYCTTFLQYIDKAGVNSESERARWRAEAHVLRAYYMLEMLKWFGAFAYEPNGYPDDYDYSTLKKRTVWELAELIDAECTAAIDTSELPWRLDNPSDVKRMTKALAWCIKSKAYQPGTQRGLFRRPEGVALENGFPGESAGRGGARIQRLFAQNVCFQSPTLYGQGGSLQGVVHVDFADIGR